MEEPVDEPPSLSEQDAALQAESTMFTSPPFSSSYLENINHLQV